MPILMPRAPVAHALPVLAAIFCVAPALSRFGLDGIGARTRLHYLFCSNLRPYSLRKAPLSHINTPQE